MSAFCKGTDFICWNEIKSWDAPGSGNMMMIDEMLLMSGSILE